ncbi:T9SS C-terminal target domain-containing protein [Pontibacter sp. 172403-2]|uniref:T9SS C-terminal target domain-containing protein n=1 Tax=Pontibacter rufus TaxID=2791028 RepID=UPI0018AF5EDC|nr:T9SS C-terminal target domain-containing protein [Pontibacter sp. 172403-2]MBF9252231.1 T9SS C-terminal target domain-containing protein [Pontibacter sp. 172403-2]
MKKLLNFILVAFVVSLAACNNDDDSNTPAPAGIAFTTAQSNGMTVVSGSTEEDFTMTADKKYLLSGFVSVKDGATLTIEPGTVIMGDKDSKGTLIIERGGKIMANGTAAKPIVFTSAQPAGQRRPGDWGGVIILGKAPVNLGANAKIEGGVDREYGGADANDNSGSLKYVRIEFPGIAFQPDNEINGLTLGGVGAGTTIDYVQVSYSGDDSFEWFGGTVNAKHLIAYSTVDDMFDTDNGYSGKLQFLVGISNPTLADVSDSNGFESDNDSKGTDATPQTSAVFSNVSLFGPRATDLTTFNAQFGRGLHIRRNSALQIYNSVVAGWPTGLLLDGAASQANATADKLKIQNTIIAGVPEGKALTVEEGSTYDVATWFNASGKGNTVVVDNAMLGIGGVFFSTGRPDFTTASQLQAGANFTGLDSFFTPVDYIGAFGTEDWTNGWTNFSPNDTTY